MAKIINKTNKIIVVCLGLLLGLCFCVLGWMLTKQDTPLSINFATLSTNDGNYYLATNGGRLYVNNLLTGTKDTLEVRSNKPLTLEAKSNPGYGFAGYYNDEEQLLSLAPILNLTPNQTLKNITARFAKLYPVNLTLTDPFNSSQQLSINTNLFVGQTITTYDLVNKFYGENYAKYFFNSAVIDTDLNMDMVSGNLNCLTIIPKAMNLSVQPSTPVDLGVPSGYTINDKVIVVYKPQGLASHMLVSNEYRSFTLKEEREDVAVYNLSPWGFQDITERFSSWFTATAQEGYVFYNWQIRFYSAQQGRWSDWLNLANSVISSFAWGDIRLVEINPFVEKGFVQTFYADEKETIHFKETYRKNTTCNLPASPTKDGFTFAGWTSNKNSNSVEWASGTLTITAEKKWYPVWKRDNTLTYSYINTQGQLKTKVDNESTQQLFSASSAVAAYQTFNIDTVSNASFTLLGKTYSFIGFSTNEQNFSGKYANTQDIPGLQTTYQLYGKAITLYAVYSTQIQVVYDALDGTNAPNTGITSICKSAGETHVNDQTVMYTLTTSKPSHSDATFNGWVYENKLYSGGNQIAITTDTVVKANYTRTTTLSGKGTSASPYLIKDAKDFTRFAAGVNQGNYTSDKQYFKVTASFAIDYLIPAGQYDYVNNKLYPFNGTFNGQGFTITINGENLQEQDYVGLFGYNSGKIQNIIVKGLVSGKTYVGGICGYNNGTLSQCVNYASVTGFGNYIGGITGISNKLVDKAYNAGSVLASGNSGTYVSGVAGLNSANCKIINAENLGNISAKNYDLVGGIVGKNEGIVANISNQGDITAKSKAGGIVGENAGKIYNGFNGGTINSQEAYCGAIIGYDNSGTIEYMYYYINSAFDGSQVLQNSIGSNKLGSVSVNPDTIQSFANEGAGAGVVIGTLERSLAYVLDIRIESYSSKDGAVYCSWSEGENGYASMYISGVWNRIISQGASVVGWTGTGTLSDPYLIGSIADLQLLAEKVSFGLSYKGSYFRQTYDITFKDSAAATWKPIGGYNEISNETFVFEGIFDGNGYIIKDLVINSHENYSGIFGYNNGVIQNVTLEKSNIQGGNYVGGITAYNTGSIINCVNTSQISGTGSYIGGIVGVNNGLVDKCKNLGNVLGKNTVLGLGVGGITGINLSSAVVRNSYNNGIVQGNNYQWIGGLIGQNHGKLANVFNRGDVLGAHYVGGLVGQNGGGKILNSYSTGLVESLNTYVGGITGHNDGDILYAYYLKNSAKDSSQCNQNGIGVAVLGQTQQDLEHLYVFNSDFTLSQITISGQTSTTLLLALNLGQKFFIAQEEGQYLVWGKSDDGYPTIFGKDDWNSTTLWDFNGEGSEVNPFLISTQEDLFHLSVFVNSGNNYTGNYFKLTSNLTLTLNQEQPFAPIGTYNTETQKANYFAGIFDGDNHFISGFTLNTTDNYQGLFGYSTGTIKNLGISCNIQGGNYVGGICGYNTGVIENCYNMGTVSGNGGYIGGIVGVQNGLVNKCYNLGNVVGANQTFGLSVGGIAGINLSAGKVQNSFNLGQVAGNNYQWIGGIVGQNHGEIKNVFSQGDVSGAYYVGGVAGQNGGGEIVCAYSSGKVTGYNSFVGAVVGDNNNGVISNTYYKTSSAKDVGNTNQNGIGNSDVGKTTKDITSQTYSFSDDGAMSTISFNGANVSSVLDALTVAQAAISVETPDTYCIWTMNQNSYPVISSMNPPVIWNPYTNQDALQGSGTEQDPFNIYTTKDLDVLRIYVNSGTTYEGKYFRLMNDIDAKGSNNFQWSPIGWYDTINKKSYYFAGTFNGNGYTLSGIYINVNSDYKAVFGLSAGTIKNLTVRGTITGGNYVGGIVGYNTGIVLNCVNNITISSKSDYIGGIVGVNGGTIERCANLANVTGQNDVFGLSVGGVVGINLSNGEIKNSYSAGKVIAEAYQWVGGVAGQNHGKLYNAYSIEEVNGAYYVGGIVGQNGGGSIENCLSYSKVKGINSYVGAVTGQNNLGTLKNNFYLASSALDGKNVSQNGEGCAEIGKKTSDDDSVISFNKSLIIKSTNILGTFTTNLIEALNATVFVDRQQGVINDAWLVGESGYPILGFVDEVWDGKTSTAYASGTGTKTNPYQISSAEELYYFAQKVNSGTSYQNSYFVLTNDIYLNGINVDSANINAHSFAAINGFEGVFNGQNYAIHGLYINSLVNNQGFFGTLDGQVSNTCLYNGYIEGLQYVGGICANNNGTITNCYNGNIIKSYGNNTGGVAGFNANLIVSCANFGTVNALGENTGGIAGKSVGVIVNSYNKAQVSSSSNAYTGGIVGYNSDAIIANSFNTGNVFGGGFIGGISGYNSGTIENTYNLGEVSSPGAYVGGVVGQNNGNVNANYYLLLGQNTGIGAASGKTNIDSDGQTTSFASSFNIKSTQINSVVTIKLVDALNAWLINNKSINNIRCLSWVMSDYPVLHNAWTGGESAAFSGGLGTKDDPYIISTAEDLTLLSSTTNKGETYLNKYFVLANDICLNDETFTFDDDTGLVIVTDGTNTAYLGTGIKGKPYGPNTTFDNNASSAGVWYSNTTGTQGAYLGNIYQWEPIGKIDEKMGISNKFEGIFDGNSYSIQGLYINKNADNLALFGVNGGIIKNFGIENSYICGDNNIAGVVVQNQVIAESVYNKAFVMAKTRNAAGVAAVVKETSTLNNAFNSGKVWGKARTGGVVGENYGTVVNLYNWQTAYQGSTLAQIIATNNSVRTNLFVWTGSGIADDVTKSVNTENISFLSTTLNSFAKENECLEWKIDPTTGEPKFVRHLIWNGETASVYAGGNGSAATPYLIANAEQLAYFITGKNTGSYAKIINDIYWNDETFTFMPDSGLIKVTDGINVGYIGTGIKGDNSGSNVTFDGAASKRGVWYVNDTGLQGNYSGEINSWSGMAKLSTSLDGGNHTIYGLYSSSSVPIGFVKELKNGTIKNLTLFGGLIMEADGSSTSSNVGGFANISYKGSITNCVNGNIIVGRNAAGILSEVDYNSYTSSPGYFSGEVRHTALRTAISDCKNLGVIIGDYGVSGIVRWGRYLTPIKNCDNFGDIYSSSYASGIIGYYFGNYQEDGYSFEISNCNNYGKIKGSSDVAGIVSLISDCFTQIYRYLVYGEIFESAYSPANITITNCNNYGALSGSGSVLGGIVGDLYQVGARQVTLSNLCNYGNLSCSGNSIGGIVGEAEKSSKTAEPSSSKYPTSLKMQNLYNYGKISSSGSNIGGIGGLIRSSVVENVENYGNVSGYDKVGGIFGQSTNTVTNAINKGTITGTNDYAGGIMGYSSGSSYTIDKAYNFASVSSKNYVGGIVGRNDGSKISNGYNGATVQASNCAAAGIAGRFDSGSLTTCYNTGSVSGKDYAGGVAGQVAAAAKFQDCKYGYGMIKASSSITKDQYGTGVASGEEPKDNATQGIERFTDNTIFAVLGGITIDDKEKFFSFISPSQGGMYELINDNGQYTIDGKLISLTDLGIKTTVEKSYIMAYKASALVTLDLNGCGLLSPNSLGWDVAANGQTATKILFANTAVSELPIPTDDVYTFAGWYKDSACLNYLVTSSTTYDFSFTKLYAKWILTKHTLTLDTGGITQINTADGFKISDDGYTATKQVRKSTPLGTLPVLKLSGHTFNGWFSDQSLTQRVSAATLYWADSDITLYPKFTKNTFEISITLDNVEWVNSGITVEIYKVGNTETLVERAENITSSIITLDEAFEEGYYRVYASIKKGSNVLVSVGDSIFVSGKVKFAIGYYSIVLTKTDGVNSVYIAEENGNSVPIKDIHNNAQVYLSGQTVAISTVPNEGDGYQFAGWKNLKNGQIISKDNFLNLTINQSYVLEAQSKKS